MTLWGAYGLFDWITIPVKQKHGSGCIACEVRGREGSPFPSLFNCATSSVALEEHPKRKINPQYSDQGVSE